MPKPKASPPDASFASDVARSEPLLGAAPRPVPSSPLVPLRVSDPLFQSPRFPALRERLLTACRQLHVDGVRVLLAVSGGTDSVAMLRMFVALQRALDVQLRVAHFNHRWRLDTSDQDAEWVRSLAASFGLPCLVGVQSHRGACVRQSETAARSVRYRFLRWAAEYFGCSAVATAHTLDDQAETVLHHLLRGSGLSGIRGIPRERRVAARIRLVRPLLDIERRELAALLADVGQAALDDPTNEDRRHTRNAIRHELLPLLRRRYNPRVSRVLSRLARQCAEAESALRRIARQLLRHAIGFRRADRVELQAGPFQGRSVHVVRQTLVELWQQQQWPRQKMTFRHWSAAADVLLGNRTRAVCPAGVTVRRRRGRIILERKPGGGPSKTAE